MFRLTWENFTFKFHFQFIYCIYIKKTITNQNVTDPQVAIKTNRGRSLLQVVKYYKCQKREKNVKVKWYHKPKGKLIKGKKKKKEETIMIIGTSCIKRDVL